MKVWIVSENVDGYYEDWEIRAVFSEAITAEEAYDTLGMSPPARSRDGSYNVLGMLDVEEHEVRERRQ